jgi:hypothetical protein
MNIIFRITDSPSKLLIAYVQMLSHVPFAVTAALPGRTISGFGELAVGPNARLCVHAPEVAVARLLRRSVVPDADEHSLPAKALAQLGMIDVETFSFVDNHRVPPLAASSIARLTATRAS